MTIVAIFEAVAGREDELAAALAALVAPTRAEDGCLDYDLHRDLERPGRFLFYENWTTRAAWNAHMESPHLRRHRETSPPLVARAEILQMEPTEGPD
ncbi:antibiotic biosynthesis monooxygenase [bacterium]|nr:antibiotic biosynthesis monooxygenase [bacterium]